MYVSASVANLGGLERGYPFETFKNYYLKNENWYSDVVLSEGEDPFPRILNRPSHLTAF